MKKSLLSMIVDLIFGYKYYCNIVNTLGTDKIEMSSFIFRTKQQAMKHKEVLAGTRSFLYVETVSFRSYKKYGNYHS